MIETRSRDESFTLLLHVAVAAALAGVTLLVIITDSWQPIYGGIIVAITLFAVIVQPWTMTTGECFQGLGMFFLVAAPIVASTLINLPEGSHVENIIVLACYAVLAVVLFPEPRDRSMVRFLTLVAITQAVVAVVVVNIILINTDDFLYLIYQGTARQALEFNDVMDANYMGTNYIGMLCTVMVFAAVAFNKLIYRAIFMGLGLALCILVSSRSGMLGVVVAYASGELLWLLIGGRQHIAYSIMAYFCAGALVIIISILYSFKIDDIIEFILDNILLVNDDLRGLDTGASGRIDLWRKALDIWLDNPLFGVGYEHAVFYIGFGLGAHNMILELLADLGAFGLICFLLFSILAARNALVLWRTGQRLMASAVAVMLIVYYAYGLFEGRAINVGNPLSSCFFLITFASCGTLRQLPNQP